MSGLWRNGAGVAGGGQRGRGAAPPKVPLTGMPNINFRDIGNGFQDGLPFRPWAKELRDKRNAANSKDNPDAH